MSIRIFGSSHIAGNYANRISDIIITEEPDIVAVELDALRAQSLFSKSHKFNFAAARKMGVFGFLFAYIGSKIQKALGNTVGFEPGVDMKKAMLAARKANSKILLIDRDFRITMKRLSNIKFSEKLKLVLSIVFAPFDKTNKAIMNELDKVPNENTIEKMLVLFKKRFPEMYDVLVEERNIYMAKNLKSIEKKYPHAEIFAVIGAGHKKRIHELLKN